MICLRLTFFTRISYYFLKFYLWNYHCNISPFPSFFQSHHAVFPRFLQIHSSFYTNCYRIHTGIDTGIYIYISLNLTRSIEWCYLYVYMSSRLTLWYWAAHWCAVLWGRITTSAPSFREVPVVLCVVLMSCGFLKCLFWHVLWCFLCSAHIWVVILVRLYGWKIVTSLPKEPACYFLYCEN